MLACHNGNNAHIDTAVVHFLASQATLILSCRSLICKLPVVPNSLLAVSNHAQAWRAVSSTNVCAAKHVFLKIKAATGQCGVV